MTENEPAPFHSNWAILYEMVRSPRLWWLYAKLWSEGHTILSGWWFRNPYPNGRVW